MDRFELTRQIRYAIQAGLSADNGHHDFEHLCRFLAAARIVSNVYPSTGPVSSGGDGGRDFQTFRTHLAGKLGPHGGFAAMAAAEPIAFSCTLQTTGLPSKIRSDVKKIAAGPSVEQVYAMVAGDLPEAKQAALKKEMTEKYEIALHILDGTAIAELLAEHDTFWIATRWLAMPAELAPPPPPEPVAGAAAWYDETRDRWRAADQSAQTMAEILDVIAGMRRATFHREARPDIGFWISQLSPVCDADLPASVLHRARYELAVGQLRGAGDLRPADAVVTAFFDAFDADRATWAELLDASVLLQYVAGAARVGRTGLGVSFIDAQHARLVAAVEARVRSKEGTLGQRAGLFSVLGSLRAHPLVSGAEMPDEPLENWDPLDVAPGDGVDRRFEPIPANTPLRDPDGVVAAWLKFADLAKKAPLVPVEAVAQLFTLLTPVLITRPRYRELASALDDLTADVAGESQAAERSRDRAFVLLRSGQPIQALTDLHDAKARWWQGDRVRGSILTMLMLSRTYERLGLPLAARQYALAAVGAAHAADHDEHSDLITQGLMMAAHLDYASGAWASAIETYEVAVMAHVQYEDDPWDTERHTNMANALLAAVRLRTSASFVGDALAQRVVALQDRTGLSQFVDPVLAETENGLSDPESFGQAVRAQFGVQPWNDLGPDRHIRWSALGLNWHVKSANSYSHVRAAERLAAAAQVLCAELAVEDLVTLPTTITIDVRAAMPAAGKDAVRNVSTNEGRAWEVDLLPINSADDDPDVDQISLELLTVLTIILFEASTTTWSKHEAAMERLYAAGLPHKLISGRPYDDVAGVVTRKSFAATDRELHRVPGAWREVTVPAPHPSIARRTDPGPGYTAAQSHADIRRRYKIGIDYLPMTLVRLRDDETFHETLAELRADGWKDWHVLLALTSARLNFRNEQHGIQWPNSAKIKLDPETDADLPLPDHMLTSEHLQFLRQLSVVQTAEGFGMEIHTNRPDLDAIDALLGDRFGYWEDDVAHEDLFGPGPGA